MYSFRYQADLIAYLDKYVTKIDSPTDIIRIFAKVKHGRRHVWVALRVLFNYLESIGYSTDYLNNLRKALPKIPSESDILESLSKFPSAPLKYQVLYNLLLDSGLRMVEYVKLINNFNERNSERLNGFYRSAIGEFRGYKQAYSDVECCCKGYKGCRVFSNFFILLINCSVLSTIMGFGRA